LHFQVNKNHQLLNIMATTTEIPDKLAFMRQCVAIDNEGNIHLLTTKSRSLGKRNDLLTRALGQLGTTIENAFSMNGCMVHMQAAGGVTSYALRMPRIRMATHWYPSIENSVIVMVPMFSAGEDRAEHTFEWTPPAGVGLYYVWADNQVPYFIAIAPRLLDPKSSMAAFRLPLPNIYGDGRVCMGREWSYRSQTGLGEAGSEPLARAVNRFWSSGWNADLLDSISSSHAMFRFTPEGAQQPVPDNWRSHCSIISHAAFNWVAALCDRRKSAVS
jgi:hypothetical protein